MSTSRKYSIKLYINLDIEIIKSIHGVFEVDEFYGENEGLVIAEVELQNEDEFFIKPDFVGEEVTGDVRYYNSFLMKKPFTRW